MSTDSPIDAVLEAEHQAEQEIARRRDAARVTINQAMNKARKISERAHRRSHTIHTGCAVRVKTECARLWDAYEQQPSEIQNEWNTPERLRRISEHMAAQLTGGTDD